MSTKADAPLVGYNTNFRHSGRLFHVQTEDSGVKHPHVITHVYTDGGRIIASRKTSYAHMLNHPELPDVVRRLMKEQHKSMLVEIRQGSYDEQSTQLPALPDQILKAHTPSSAPTATARTTARKANLTNGQLATTKSSASANTPPASSPIPTLNELILRYLDEELGN